MTATLQTTTVEGLVCLVVATPTLQLAVLPDVGAKVISLVHQASGHEFLWRHPGRPLQRPTYSAPYDHYDLSGWDECFPNHRPGSLPSRTVAGHCRARSSGELWSLPWSWEFGEDRLHMWVEQCALCLYLPPHVQLHPNRYSGDYVPGDQPHTLWLTSALVHASILQRDAEPPCCCRRASACRSKFPKTNGLAVSSMNGRGP